MDNETKLTTAKAQQNLLNQVIELLNTLGKTMELDAKEKRVPWKETYAESAIESATTMIKAVANHLRVDDTRAMINQPERKALAAIAYLCKGWRENGVPDEADQTLTQLLFTAFPDIKWGSVAERLNQ